MSQEPMTFAGLFGGIDFDSDDDNQADLNEEANDLDCMLNDSMNSCCTDYTTCCGKQMSITSESSFLCDSCGSVKQNFGSEGGIFSETFSSKLSISKCGNKGKYSGQIISSSNSDYNLVRMQFIFSKYLRAQNTSQKKIETHILIGARDKVVAILQHKTFRGERLRKVMASCLKYELIYHNKTWSDRDIAGFMQLESKGLSEGDSIVTSMAVKGIITIPMNTPNIESCIHNVLFGLSMDDGYYSFIYDLIAELDRRNLMTSHSIYTKCIMIIWIIINIKELNITSAEVCQKCNIQKNTFIAQAKELLNHKACYFRVFMAHKMPIPNRIRD